MQGRNSVQCNDCNRWIVFLPFYSKQKLGIHCIDCSLPHDVERQRRVFFFSDLHCRCEALPHLFSRFESGATGCVRWRLRGIDVELKSSAHSKPIKFFTRKKRRMERQHALNQLTSMLPLFIHHQLCSVSRRRKRCGGQVEHIPLSLRIGRAVSRIRHSRHHRRYRSRSTHCLIVHSQVWHGMKFIYCYFSRFSFSGNIMQCLVRILTTSSLARRTFHSPLLMLPCMHLNPPMRTMAKKQGPRLQLLATITQLL